MRHFFESYILIQQDILTSKISIEKFLSLPGIIDLSPELSTLFYDENTSSLVKWQFLAEVLETRMAKKVNF